MIQTVTNPGDQCFLEICIPTFNRHRELGRLLTVLENEIRAPSETATVRITISDNCSPDGTQAMLREHRLRDRIVVRRQPSNIGVSFNIWDLFERSNAQYVWIVGDDDIPKAGSLAKIIGILSSCAPAALTFEFEQPPGTTERRHGNSQGIEVLSDRATAVPHLLILGKLTKYIVHGTQLPSALCNVRALKDTGYGWLAVILEAVRLAGNRPIVVDHEFLAGCDENYARLTDGLTPRFWDDYLLLLDHPLVSENCADYAARYRRGHGRYMVQLMYGVLAGAIQAEKTDIFERRGRELPFDAGYFRNPFVLLEWLCLRSGIPASRLVCEMETRSMGCVRRLLRPLRSSAM